MVQLVVQLVGHFRWAKTGGPIGGPFEVGQVVVHLKKGKKKSFCTAV